MCVVVLLVCRLVEDRGVINRYGFNSEGMQAAEARLKVHFHYLPLTGIGTRSIVISKTLSP